MPYDDPSLKQFEKRAENWAIAIGLQKVDGLTPSKHLISVAKKHIEGKISSDKAVQLVDRYYETKTGHDAPEDKKEADRVSARINQIIEEDGFYLSPTYLTGLHGLIFEGVFPHAGFVREVNLKREIVSHFARFIAGIWQIHPFREGNTRTVAVFAIKYLRSMRIAATNEIFAENSWYFRNALVRANYDNPLKGIARDFEPLERFFGNLILGEQNELKSRYLLVGLTEEGKRKLRELSEGKAGHDVPKGGQKKAVRKKRSEKSGQKTVDKLLSLLKANPRLTQEGMVNALMVTRSTIQKHLANLKSAGRIRRVGPDKGGHWEVLI